MSGRYAWSLSVTSVVLAIACYSTFTGIYWVKDVGSSKSGDLVAQVDRAIADLGFKRQPPIAPDVVWFLKERGDVTEAASNLEGADARMTVAVDLREPSVAIRDLSHSSETEFNRIVRSRIEDQLQSLYGESAFSFERQVDLPFPN